MAALQKSRLRDFSGWILTHFAFGWQSVTVFALCLAAGKLSIEIRSISGNSALIWLPSGVSLAALTLNKLKLWPAVFLAALMVGTRIHYGYPITFLIAVGSTTSTVLGAYFMKRLSLPYPVTLSRVKEVLMLTVIVMGFCAGLGSAIEVGGLYVGGFLRNSDVLSTWRSWWLSESMSDLFIGGVLICWRNDIRLRLGREIKIGWEFLLLTLAIFTVVIFNFTGLIVYDPPVLLRPYLLFAIVIWGALRFELAGAMMVNLIVAAGLMYGRFHGYSPPSPVSSDIERAAIQQLFALTLGTVGVILAAAIREKTDALSARIEFLAMASHELKTPITAVNLQLQFFLKKIRESGRLSSTEEEVKFVNLIGSQVGRMIQVIEKLFEVSRIDHRGLELNLASVQLSSLVESLLFRLGENIRAAGCVVETDIPATIVGNWDRFRLEQVFENIVSNALRYAVGSNISINATERGGTVGIEIRDDGPGMSEDIQVVIFDRFMRGDSKMVKARNGLGLGLFIAKQIVEAHLGKITVESRVGNGTAFFIRLPLQSSLNSDSSIRPQTTKKQIRNRLFASAP